MIYTLGRYDVKPGVLTFFFLLQVNSLPSSKKEGVLHINATKGFFISLNGQILSSC
jgi:hypothetical protein